MIFQSAAIAEILLGRDAGWQVQRRDGGEVPAKELMRKYAWPTSFGLALAAGAYAVSLPLLLWMAPVLIGLLLCIPIGMLSSRVSDPGSKLFRTPEQTAPPPVLLVELEAFHSRKVVLERRKGGAKLVSDVDLIPRKGKRQLLARLLRHRKARAAPTN